MSKMGRPKSFSTDDIKEVIKLYFYHTDGKVLLNASQIAKFAQNELGLVGFAYYTIKRNQDANQYMEELNNKIKDFFIGREEEYNAYFKSIDIESYLNMTKEQLREALINLNIALETTSDKYVDVLRNTYKAKRELTEMEKESKGIQEELLMKIESLQEENKELSDKLLIKQLELNNLEQNTKLAWDKEAGAILAKTGILISEIVQENTESAVITSPHEKIMHLNVHEEKSGRKKFLDKIEGLD